MAVLGMLDQGVGTISMSLLTIRCSVAEEACPAGSMPTGVRRALGRSALLCAFLLCIIGSGLAQDEAEASLAQGGAFFKGADVSFLQQVENSVLSPLLSKKFVGLPPTLVLIALAIGGELWGILGAILAIPLFGILFEFLRDFLKKKREEEAVTL